MRDFTIYSTNVSCTRSPDGQCLILSSRDGYCTLVVFDDIIPAYHTQQQTLQLQSIAHHNSVPLSYSNNHASSSSTQVTPAATPSSANITLPVAPTPTIPKKRSDPPLTPAASVDGSETYFPSSMVQAPEQPAQSAEASSSTSASGNNSADKVQEPPKKKRRVALTRVGDLES